MEITNNRNQPIPIFNEINSYNMTQPTVIKTKNNNFDFFEKQQFKNITKKKKLAMTAGIALGAIAIISMFINKKGTQCSALAKKLSNKLKRNQKFDISKQTSNLLKPADEYLEKNIKAAKTSIIDDLKTNKYSCCGVALTGPNSIGKNAIIDDLLHSAEEAGIYIEKIPRLDTTNTETIEKSKEAILYALRDAHAAATERFKNTKQNSVIVVNDLDKIALERSKYHIHDGIISSLLRFDKSVKSGYSWIAIADSFKEVDGAVIRPGRIAQFVTCRPSLKDSKEVWQKYVELLNSFNKDPKTEMLLNDAIEKIKNLFG